MGKSRVGLIRCDMHGMYYGALMAEHDPLRLQRPMADPGEAPYSWQTGGAHFYFYTHYSDPSAMTVPHLHEFEIARVWDESGEAAKLYAEMFSHRPVVCDSFEDVSDDVDLVLIADCNGDGSDHLGLASPGIEKRVPTFIDKPFASTFGDARSLVDLALKHDTPILSLSILGMLPHTARFAARFPEVGDLHFVSIRGGGPTLAGQIHAISLAQGLFGTGVEAVRSAGANPGGFIHLIYPEGPAYPLSGAMLNCDSGATYHCAFYASAFGTMGAIHSGGMGDFEFPWGACEIVRKIRQMVDTGRPVVPYAEMLENAAVVSAFKEAHGTGGQVSLREVGYDPSWSK